MACKHEYGYFGLHYCSPSAQPLCSPPTLSCPEAPPPTPPPGRRGTPRPGPPRGTAQLKEIRRQLPSYQQETTTVKKVAGKERDDLHNVYSFPVDKLLEAEDPEPDIHEDNQEERKGEEECCVLFVLICVFCVLFFMHFWHTIEKHRGQSQTS